MLVGASGEKSSFLSLAMCTTLVPSMQLWVITDICFFSKVSFQYLSNGGSSWISPYGHSVKYLAVVPYYTLVTLWHILVNKLVSLTPQTNNTCRKLRVSAFQWYKSLGVADRVFITKYSLAQNGWGCNYSRFWGDLELRPLFEKYETCGDSYVRSTERKSLPVLKTLRTLQSQLNNGFCQQQWANYHLAVLVQPTYLHKCGTSTVNLANLAFFRCLKCQNFGIWPCS